jgi:dipeptidase
MHYFISVFLVFTTSIFACSNVLVTKKASKDGSVIVAHVDDDEVGDQRIVYVPAKDYKKGAKRPVYPHTSVYPRYVGTARGKAYDIKKFQPTKPIGYIDQVEHTYAYFDGNYGIINEHQLCFGEATAASNYSLEPSKDRLFTSDELSRVALERCKKAKEAIILMGELAEKYGYYGWGEILLVGDTEEGWVFEICGTPHGKNALWVAKKVPDGEVFVNANIFRIREVDPNDPDMLFSSNLFEVAKENKWYDPKKEKLDWLKAVTPGEYNHPYYSLRRIWRLQTKVNPSLKVSAWPDDGYTKEYPFSIKAKNKLSVRDVISLFRDHYEGTEFDLTKGIAAGPFGCPNRYTGDYDLLWHQPGKDVKLPLKGAWERPLSVFYCGYVHVSQARGYLPDSIGAITWVGLDTPYTSCFMPFYPAINDLPHPMQKFTPQSFELDEAWWYFNFVANWATLKYNYMKKDIQKLQALLEDKEFATASKIEKQALDLYNKKNLKAMKKLLTDYCNDNTHYVLNRWWILAKYLIAKYIDGYINIPKVAENVGYPRWWRDEVGYQNGPKEYKKSNEKIKMN